MLKSRDTYGGSIYNFFAGQSVFRIIPLNMSLIRSALDQISPGSDGASRPWIYQGTKGGTSGLRLEAGNQASIFTVLEGEVTFYENLSV